MIVSNFYEIQRLQQRTFPERMKHSMFWDLRRKSGDSHWEKHSE